ncbi:hypothetical protein Droror1_Dr00026839 [Drosera rotundifolia]
MLRRFEERARSVADLQSAQARAEQAEKDLEAAQPRAKKAERDAKSSADALAAKKEKATYLKDEVVSLRADKETLCQGRVKAERAIKQSCL